MKPIYHWFDRSLRAILEGIEDKIPSLTNILLGDNSRWAGKGKFTPEETASFILSLREWDPTQNQAKFVPYIVRQLANQRLNAEPDQTEDLGRISKVLEYFYKNSRSPQWQHHRDINRFSNWRQLEELATKASPVSHQSKRQSKKTLKAGIEDLGTIVVPNEHQTTYVLYRITEPEAAIILGFGTRWCTSSLNTKGYIDGKVVTYTPENPPTITYPDWHQRSGEERPLQWMNYGTQQGFATTAAWYMGMTSSDDEGALYVILQTDDGPKPGNIGRSKQIAQFTQSATQFKDPSDRDMQSVCAPLHYAMVRWAQHEPNIDMLLRKVHKGEDLNDVQNSVGFPIEPRIELNSTMELITGWKGHGYDADPIMEEFRVPVEFHWKARPAGESLCSQVGTAVDVYLVEFERGYSTKSYLIHKWYVDENPLDDSSTLEILRIALAIGAPLDYDALDRQIKAVMDYLKSQAESRYELDQLKKKSPDTAYSDHFVSRMAAKPQLDKQWSLWEFRSFLSSVDIKKIPILHEFRDTFEAMLDDTWLEMSGEQV